MVLSKSHNKDTVKKVMEQQIPVIFQIKDCSKMARDPFARKILTPVVYMTATLPLA